MDVCVQITLVNNLKQFSLLVVGVGMPGSSFESLGSLIPSWCSLKEYASSYPTTFNHLTQHVFKRCFSGAPIQIVPGH